MLIFAITIVIFCLLFKFLIGNSNNSQHQEWKREEILELKFKLPREIIANDRPEIMEVAEREKRRRKIINQAFQAGFFAKQLLLAQQEEDRALAAQPYKYLGLNKKYVIKYPNQPVKQTRNGE